MKTLDENRDFLDQSIPVLSNRLILEFMKREIIKIDHYDPEMLGPTSYRLRASKLRFHQADEDGIPLADGTSDLEKSTGRVIHPGEYVVVSPKETIFLSEGAVADFYPASLCIEHNLTVTAGRLDANYHRSLVFGVYNAGTNDFTITKATQVLRVSFGWLGQFNLPDYSGNPPGSYIPKLEQLREAEKSFDAVATEALNSKKRIEEQIKKLSKG